MKAKKSQKVVVVAPEIAPVAGSPAQLIELAITKGRDLDALERVLGIQERYLAMKAKEEYNAKMVAVHRGMPSVAKTLKNDQTNSKYASLDDIVRSTKEVYTSHGFSISFYEGQTEKVEHIRICADVLHEKGHKETYYYDVPLDGKGIKGNVNMTPIHAKASSTSYARRYLMCMIWNIPTGDDDDGQAASGPEETVNEKELSLLVDMTTSTEADMKRFLKLYKARSLEAFPKSKFKQAYAALEQKFARKKGLK